MAKYENGGTGRLIMQEAIEKLKELASDNDAIADRLESEKVILGSTAAENKRHMVRVHAYRYWSLCLLMVVHILENSNSITGETIPYEVALVGNRELTNDEIERGKELESLALEYLENSTGE